MKKKIEELAVANGIYKLMNGRGRMEVIYESTLVH